MIQINYLILSISLILWCVIHSTLISNQFISYINNKFGSRTRYYRLFFNLFSLLTFVPIILFSLSIKGEAFFSWTGYLQLLRAIAIFTSLYLFYAGARHYDALQFLGIRQIRSSSNHRTLTDSGHLDISGILGVIRHPWYSASIIIIWARNIEMSVFIVNIILTSYLIIGTYLEEKKLVLEFGEEYRSYQRSVSMLFPYKWLKSKILGRNTD
jgi:protein-S-isoprenylcysteine O-methyltransferase Ste14